MSLRKFLLIFIFGSASPIKLSEIFRTSVQNTHPLFLKFLNFKLSHQQLISHFRSEARALAPESALPGQSLSEVIFNFVTFDPFFRRTGKEVLPPDFSSSFSQILKQAEAVASDSDLAALKKKAEQLFNGLVKTVQKFRSSALVEAERTLNRHLGRVQIADSKQNFFNVRFYNHLFTRFKEILVTQNDKFQSFSKLSTDSVYELEKLLLTLAAQGLQEDFAETDRKELRLRFLEVSQTILSLYHYDRFKIPTIEFRNDNLLFQLSKFRELFANSQRNPKSLTKKFANLYLAMSHGSDGRLKEEEDFHNLIAYSQRLLMRNVLELLRKR